MTCGRVIEHRSAGEFSNRVQGGCCDAVFVDVEADDPTHRVLLVARGRMRLVAAHQCVGTITLLSSDSRQPGITGETLRC
jgi:hypothetical protein